MALLSAFDRAGGSFDNHSTAERLAARAIEVHAEPNSDQRSEKNERQERCDEHDSKAAPLTAANLD
jgi:hypothetical protein